MTTLPLSVPLHSRAGVTVPLHSGGGEGLGFIDVIAGVAGTIFGGLMQDKSEKRALQAQERALAQRTQAELQIARMTVDQRDREVEAASRTAVIQAQHELMGVRSAMATKLLSDRMAARVAEDATSSSLYAGTQSGMFNIATTRIQQAGDISKSVPRTGATAMTLMVLGIAGFAAWSMRPVPKKRRRKKKGSTERTVESYAPATEETSG